ncbi:unnamed protein product [Didymodactylos carnosus]|uniref:Dynein regulatory complex protein 10 n=1 Tax=Didymodactylos carnosus TaxID=1234261 RepID=A0A814UXH4_9BILA|nr:unnamed protein product [Didymodactylos carnosus]CAF1180133.1 unnamed protein product [Didymodactylos carnosus]CAF3672600.1 unnamed protein product [Didymodactylos carnosus]CAF3944454.1 unnamed protein product [Didymodactylos carnosus]
MAAAVSLPPISSKNSNTKTTKYLSPPHSAEIKHIRLQLDPLRLHEPARTKLSTLETQRIMIVFDDLVRKIELVEYLPIIVNNMDLFKNILDQNTVAEIDRHNRLKAAYESGHSLKSISNMLMSQQQTEKAAYHYYIQQSIRNILRDILHKNRFDIIKETLSSNDLLPPQKEVMKILKTLRESAMERFLTTPNEEREKVEELTNLNDRLISNERVIRKLEKELNDAIQERDTEVGK